jgi:chemotaxis signal transduction protein
MCGLLVDDIDDIIEIAEEDIDCLPVTVNGKLADFLHGLLNFNGNPISIVNLHNIYFSEEIKKFDYED